MSENKIVYVASSVSEPEKVRTGNFPSYGLEEGVVRGKLMKDIPGLKPLASYLLDRLEEILNDGCDDEELSDFTDTLYNLTITHTYVHPISREVHTMQYNRVQGIHYRKFGLISFLKKYLKDNPGSFSPDIDKILAPYIVRIFPNYTSYKLTITDTPSEMYEPDLRGPHSCMVGEDYVKFYDTAPVQGAMLFNPAGRLIARCIIWTFDDGTVGFDRVYSTEGGAGKYLECKLAEMGMVNVYDDPHHDLTVTAPINSAGLPYMDSLHYVIRLSEDKLRLSSSDRTLLNSVDDSENVHVHGTSSTSGGPGFLPYVTTVCGQRMDRDSVYDDDDTGKYYPTCDVHINEWKVRSIMQGEIPATRKYVWLQKVDGSMSIVPVTEIDKWEMVKIKTWWGTDSIAYKLKDEV